MTQEKKQKTEPGAGKDEEARSRKRRKRQASGAKSPRTPGSETAPQGELPPATEQLWRRIRPVLLRIGLVVALAAATFGSLEVKRHVERDPRFQLRHWELRLGEFPTWVTPEVRDRVLGPAAAEESLPEAPPGDGPGTAGTVAGLLGRDALEGTIFRAGLLADLRQRLERNPWIRSVHHLRLNYPGTTREGGVVSGGLELELELRRPIAGIRFAGQYYLSDAEGVCPGRPFDEAAFQALQIPTILGGEDLLRQSPPRAGERWQRPEILEGIEVARVLFQERINERFPHNPVVAIDISNVGGRLRPRGSEIILHAYGVDVPLAWGRSPIARGARISPVSEVIAKLETVLAEPARALMSDAEVISIRLDQPGDIIRESRS